MSVDAFVFLQLQQINYNLLFYYIIVQPFNILPVLSFRLVLLYHFYIYESFKAF